MGCVRSGAWSGLLGGCGALLVVGGITAAAVGTLSWRDAVDGFVVSSLALGAILLASGVPIARADPRSAVGWLLAVAGVLYASSGAGYAVLASAVTRGSHGAGWRLVADVTSVGWPLAAFGAIPAAYLCFPSGRPPRRLRAVAVGTVALTCAVALAAMAFGIMDTTADLAVYGFLAFVPAAAIPPLIAVAGVLAVATYGMVATVLAIRFRRGAARTRQQILWVFVATVFTVVEPIVELLLGVETLASVLVLALPPIATVVAILRYELVDITNVASRLTVYGVLTVLGLATFMGLVTLADAVVTTRSRFAPPVLTALVIAVAFDPARRWLQSRVDRVFFGTHRDPAAAVTSVSEALAGIESDFGLSHALREFCQGTGLPWARLIVGGETVAVCGVSQGDAAAREVRQDVRVIVGLRRGQRRLTKRDERLLDAVGSVLGVAVDAALVARSLARTRRSLARTRDDERRRLRRDLHDDVGPSLAAAALQIDAARRLPHDDPVARERAMAHARDAVAAASTAVRRIVETLRPPVLDSLGLVRAIAEHAESLTPMAVTVDASGSADALSPAAEAVVYRIAVEALTNAVRHSSGSSASVRLRASASGTEIVIADDGVCAAPWRPGVGLTSMRERVAELGGTLDAGPYEGYGRVRAWVPAL